MALSLFRAPVLPLALIGGVAAFLYSQRRREAKQGPAVPPQSFPEPGPPPGGEIPPAGGATPPSGPPPVGPAGSRSNTALIRYQAAVAANRPAVIQEALWAQYTTALATEGLPIPDRPPSPSSGDRVLRIAYCSRSGGCAIVDQPYSVSEIARALLGEPLGVLEDPGTGWLRVRYPAGPVLGRGRPIRIGWIETSHTSPSPPAPPPGQPPPAPAPLEPKDGDPCLGEGGCRLLLPSLINTATLEPQSLHEDTLDSVLDTVPNGGQVDILEGPVTVRLSYQPAGGGGNYVVFTPLNFYDPATRDPNVVSYYRIRYCVPGSNLLRCLEGWAQRRDLVLSG